MTKIFELKDEVKLLAEIKFLEKYKVKTQKQIDNLKTKWKYKRRKI